MTMSHNMKHLNGLDPTKVVSIGGKSHPTADGLVDKAHRNAVDRGFYITGVDMHALLLPTPELPMCIFKATVRGISDYEPGVEMSFSEIGDATPQNCTSANTAAAYPRMASTRAVSRALALALNVSEAVAEEIMAAGGAPAPGMTYPAQVAPAGVPGMAPPVAAPQQYAAAPAVAAGVPGGVHFNGQGYVRSTGQALTAYTKDTKGKQLTDPVVTVSTLEWMGANANLSDKITPDMEFRNACTAEIGRRNGTAPVQAAPQYAASPPGIAPPGLAPPVGQPMGVPPQAMSAAPPPPMTPPPMAVPMAPPPPAANVAWIPTATDLQNLLAASTTRGHDWAALTAYVQSQPQFAGRVPQSLNKQEFNSVMVAYGGQPVP